MREGERFVSVGAFSPAVSVLNPENDAQRGTRDELDGAFIHLSPFQRWSELLLGTWGADLS